MPANGKILDTIDSLYDSLTKTEKKIAKTILSNPQLLNQASLSAIAVDLDVGEATFIRFCRTLGFKGFTDFKMDLAIELATQDKSETTLLDTDVTVEDSAQNIALKLQAVINNVIKIDTVKDIGDIKNENGSVPENMVSKDITYLNNSEENHLETVKIDVTEGLIENSNYENLIPDTENYTSGIDLSEKKDSHSEYSIDLFEGNWEKIRKEIKNSGAILNALMADTYPEGIKNGVLTIRFPDGHKFHSRQIMELDKQTKIETVINKICNTDIRITTIFDNDNRENSDNEFIEKVINFFDGEIIEKK